jgi:hypothetical protein
MALETGQPSAPAAGAAVISFEDRLRSRREAIAGASPREQHDLPGGPIRARVAAVTDTCWCCRQKVRAVVGVLVEPRHTADGSGFLPLERVDERLLDALDERVLSRRGIGALRHRESPGVAGGYIANGCIECDALIGRFHLEDLLTEHRMSGASYGQLDIGIGLELELASAETGRSLSALG